MSEEESLMESGFAAMARGAWQEARDCFMSLIEKEPGAEAYEGLSWAAWSLNDPELLFEARQEAFRLFRQANDDVSAARLAMWLGTDYMDFRNELSICKGWHQRAESLLVGQPVAPEHGWLMLLRADAAIMAEEDAPRARKLAMRAIELGRQLGIRDIEAIGLAIEGVGLVFEGEPNQGMRLLEEASVWALSGEMSDPGYVAWALCYLIYACESVRDYDRAVEWCDKMREWADRGQMALLRGICRVRLAGILIWQGNWPEAEAQLFQAGNSFIPQRGLRAADVKVRLAELRRRQGQDRDAEVLFREVEYHPLALLGLAELALEAGRPKDAEELISRFLRKVPPSVPFERAKAFELQVRVFALLGERRRGEQALRSLRELSTAAETQPLRAATSFCAALLAVARQDYERGMAALEDAVDLYEQSGAPYEVARARLELASVLVMLGRLPRAKDEAKRAHGTLEQLNSRLQAVRANALLQDINRLLSEAEPRAADQSQLTHRQLQILSLMARGLSNREIAEALVVSEHTVHRHVANILQRLDLPSRAAAAAYAVSHNLI
jgi:DNA-binding NarL/FixJ family response regulator